MKTKSDSTHQTTGNGDGSAYDFGDTSHLKREMGITDKESWMERHREVTRLLYLPDTLSSKELDLRVVRAFELLESIAPNDGLESMLGLQMVATHSAALECVRRAMTPGQMLPAIETNLRSAEKLMALYLRQIEALNRNRGKGQQKVIVEYVNVEPGAQAIVGSVEAGRPQRMRGKRLQLEPEADPVQLDLTAEIQNSGSRKKSRHPR